MPGQNTNPLASALQNLQVPYPTHCNNTYLVVTTGYSIVLLRIEAYFDLAGLMAGHLISSGHIRKDLIWEGLTEELITDIKTLWS